MKGSKMKINVTIDLSEVFAPNETVEEWLTDIIKSDIKQQLKKCPEYKTFIQQKTDEALAKIKV